MHVMHALAGTYMWGPALGDGDSTHRVDLSNLYESRSPRAHGIQPSTRPRLCLSISLVLREQAKKQAPAFFCFLLSTNNSTFLRRFLFIQSIWDAVAGSVLVLNSSPPVRMYVICTTFLYAMFVIFYIERNELLYIE